MIVKYLSSVHMVGRLIFRAIGVLLLGVAVMSCAERPSPIPEGTDTHWYGNIISGEKFGVKIGDDYSSARDVLVKDGYFSGELVSCSRNNGVTFECSAPQEFELFRSDRFGKDGVVFLVIADEAVVQIVWSFAVISLP